ncbi:MAG: hypothetical protein HDR25_04285 [Lachnospiraceae bacterium]|nr:hypothetical protein [Lachnospiraceae bacterium]
MYGVQGVDIILNSTGGDGKKEKINSYVYGFNRRGKALSPHLLNGKSCATNIPGGIYLFDLTEDDNDEEVERGFYQKETVNKKGDFRIPVGNIDSILEKSKKLDDKLFVYIIIRIKTSYSALFKTKIFFVPRNFCHKYIRRNLNIITIADMYL